MAFSPPPDLGQSPQLRNNGQGGTAGSNGSGKLFAQGKHHSWPAPEKQSLHTVISPPDGSGNVVVLQHDANTNGGQLVIQTLSSAGAVDAAKPQVQLAQNDLGAVDGDGRIAKWRLMAVCDSSGAPMQAMVAMSEPEDLS